MRIRRQLSSEDGAVAIVTAIILTVLIALMAFVVDYGLVRTDIRSNQSASDAASQAGVGVLGDGGTYEEACQASAGMLEVNLGITLSAGLCNPFSPGTFETVSVSCEDRANSVLDATQNPATVAPVYVEETVGDYTIRIQMPVRDDDPQMDQQTIYPAHDGTDPCQRVAVSVRRSRDLIFGGFAGGTGSASGFADAVSRYEVVTGEEEISSLVVLDPTGCGALDVASNNGRLLVENVEDVSGTVIQRGLITVDSTGAGCGNNKYVMLTGGSGARLCAGVDPDNIVEPTPGDVQLATGFCDSLVETLQTPSVNTAVTGADPYGKAVSEANIVNRNVEPVPVPDGPVTRRPVDHNFNCRDAATNSPSAFYPLSGASGDAWHPLYESIESCEMGRAANLDELAEDLATGASFTTHSSWQTVSGAACSIAPGDDITIGDGTTNLYFDCGTLDVKGTLRLFPDEYIVVRGWIDATNNSTRFSVNVDGGGGNLAEDAVMVVQGMKSGTDEGLRVGSSSVANINRTAVYLHQGVIAVNADDMRWTAPEDTAYKSLEDGGGPETCVEVVSFGTYDLPSPECFQKLAMWSNNTGTHQMRGGGQLDVAGVFFAPYAGRVGTTAFDLAGDTSHRLARAQFFTYKFKLSGGSLLSMRPDPNFNVFTSDVVLRLIR